MAPTQDTVPPELPRSRGTQDANTSRRRKSLPGRSTSLPRQRPSGHVPPMPPASPEIISSLISSLSSISSPARTHFDNLPHISAQTAPSSPGFHQTEFAQSQVSGQGFGVDYGAYKTPNDAAESPFLHPDDAALAPVVRMAPAPTPSSPRSPRSPKLKNSFGRDRSPLTHRSTSSFSSSQAAMEEQSLSGFGIITTEPGPRVSRAGSVASTSSDGRRSLRGALGMLRRGSRDSWQDKEAERSIKSSSQNENLKPNLARSRTSLKSKNSMADVVEEGAILNPAEDLSFKNIKDATATKQSSHPTPNPSLPSPGGIGSGRIIPTRESSLRHTINKAPRKSRHSRSTEQRPTTSKERSYGESAKTSEAKAATEQTTKRIQQVKEQQKRIKNELAKAQEVPAGRTSIDTFNSRAKTTQPVVAEHTSTRLSQDDALISRYLQHAETDPFEESAPSPAIQTRRTREKKRQSLDRADVPPSPSVPKNHKRHSSGAFTMATRQSIAEERPSSADSIDLAVEAYVASPRLTQKVPHPRSGRMIAFSEVGDPKGHVIFCCLGMGLTRYLMAFYDELARTLKLRLVTLDRPGVGESDPSGEGEGTPLTWPDDVAIVCNHLKITKFSILAHSAGAIYALATALRIPQHIRGRIHLLAPWIPPSQMTNLGTHKEPLPNNAVPYSQRLLRALPTPFLKVANSSFMNATSSSLTTSLPKSPRRNNKRKSFGRDTVAPTVTELTSSNNNTSTNTNGNQTKNDRNSTMTTASNSTSTPFLRNDQRNSTLSQTSAINANRPTAAEEAAILASQQKERQTEYDTRLTYRIWELATTNANPAVDLLICLERRQTIGFRYVDINREVVIHHGTKDTRVPVDNVRWLGKTMRRCEVRVLEGEGHGLMASAVVMSNVLTEMAKEWEDWTTVVQGRAGRGRRSTVTATTAHYTSRSVAV
ncbi:hydrolase, alpha/beta fold family protein [Talaromyces stipitatus ATCC 10500]|uniref:Hydrolase, alpha/beta fold family protein n=1 Tax=Talaromyces stipitatus (strain ATCC 10500 / CBS 375.48 / QM 6759 / NRRL 1006) TaxID=441959 RepID=B8M737_TALSN|nr:hydrolase, alpha/beta fold family protein [Talaromyces stipitatus ATCC 10500]EED20257.1 hydrolase, alpha/beta fold family protein [Talaromyces stipitatus ATCC 10500]